MLIDTCISLVSFSCATLTVYFLVCYAGVQGNVYALIRWLLSVASTPHCHSFAYPICNLHPCACLRCKQAGLLLLALRWPPCLSTVVLGSGPAFCCLPNRWHT